MKELASSCKQVQKCCREIMHVSQTSLSIMSYEKHVLVGLNEIYYWALKYTTCYHYTNIIKSGLINLIKIGNIYTTEKGLA